jgi:signal transduction histidine kinase
VLTLHSEESFVGHGDRARLAQAIDNILDNAIKFGRGHPIEVELRGNTGTAVLMVRDRGIGIAPEQATTVFAAFYRGVPAASYGGLGLGLYVAQAIVEAHHGTITAQSTPDDGTTFTVRLPGFVRAVPPRPESRP